MKLVTEHATYDVEIKFNRYMNRGTAIELLDVNDGSSVMVATTNPDLPEIDFLVNQPDGDKFVVIKTYSENDGVEAFLKQEGIIPQEREAQVQVGYEICPLYMLTEKAMNMMHEQLGPRPERTEEDRKREMEEYYRMIDEL